MISKAYSKFLIDLELNNNREWFTSNKELFKVDVESPFLSFISGILVEVSKIESSNMPEPKTCIFRIYRDIRFSKDKTPYKTHMAAMISPGGKGSMNSVGVYLEVGTDYVDVYAGAYQPDNALLYNIRSKITSNQSDWNDLIKSQTFVKLFGSIQGDKSKILPKEFKEAAQYEPFIFNKQFYVKSQISRVNYDIKNLQREIILRYKEVKKLNDFLDVNE